MNKSREFTSLDTFYIVQELQELVGAFLNKVYMKGSSIYLVFRKSKTYTLVIGPNHLHLTNYKTEFPKQPPMFAMLLRKHLVGSRLENIGQHNFDRVVVLEFSNKKSLVAEIFGKGNILLLDENKNIIQPLHFQEWKARSLKPKKVYEFPPEGSNPKTITKEEFLNHLQNSDKDIVRALAIDFGFGGEYAEKICSTSKVEKNKPCKDLSSEEATSVYNSMKALLNSKPENFNDFWDNYFSKEEFLEVKEVEESEKEKLEKLLEKQEQNLKNILKNIKKWKEEADKLSIEQKFNEATFLYEKIKKKRKKIPGLEKAISETKEKIKSVAEKVIEIKEPERKVEREKKWFEKFRYFYTSIGSLVVCGKDASTNELLIKKYTEPWETVFHADITGAPFCVIKDVKEPKESELKETAILSACYSKAWQRGLGSVDVYWVKGEQLDKKAPAGEYVGKGAFIVHGKKNYFRNTSLKLAIGLDKDFNVIAGAEESIKSMAIVYSLICPGNIKSKELAQKIKQSWIKKVSKEKAEKIKKINLEEIQKFIPAGKGELV